jgi:hypothetical protein
MFLGLAAMMSASELITAALVQMGRKRKWSSKIVQEDRESLRLRLSGLWPLALELSFAESNRLRLSGLADNNRQYTYENKGCQSVVL